MSGNVLIVDDSLTVRMDLAETFESAGFRALPCATVAQAREEIAKGGVDVIVLDVLLPDGDGIDLLLEVRANSAAAKSVVLMLSSEAEVGDRIRGLKTGADEYVGKPYDANYVVRKALDLLRIRRHDDDASRTSVLVIDDSATIREQLRTSLASSGFDVLTAENGEEGLKLAADHRPRAIIVDGMMPGIDGATVIRRLRLDAALRGIPCLLLTAEGDRAAELRALEAGADAFVSKDEAFEVIQARLAAIVRSAAATSADPSESLLGPKRILAVDDSMTYRQELAAALRSDGYDVVLARSGEEALELLSVQPVDCILLDLMMPGLGGQETCRRIKSAPTVRDVPLIMLTALEDRAAMIDGLSAGADDFISKSSELDVLRARVRAQIRRKQFEDEHRRIREELHRKAIEAAEARAAQKLAETRAALAVDLKHANEELEAFSYSVSHDLRAPLRSIDGFSLQLVEDHARHLDVAGLDALRRIRAATQRMADLIDDLLRLSRVSRAPLVRQHVDVTALATSIVAELRSKDPARDVAVTIEADLEVEADARLLRIALENLLGNAWKFTGKTAAAKIELGSTLEAGVPVFFVHDNGAGFDANYANRLFQPFQRLHQESDFAGTGIGLATVQRIVVRHGGRVRAEGSVGHGATIYFSLRPARSQTLDVAPVAAAAG